jgi:hypothetical protein
MRAGGREGGLRCSRAGCGHGRAPVGSSAEHGGLAACGLFASGSSTRDRRQSTGTSGVGSISALSVQYHYLSKGSNPFFPGKPVQFLSGNKRSHIRLSKGIT